MNCWHCNSNLIWGCDYTYEDLGYEGEGIVSVFTCSNKNCGAEYECKLPIEEEK